MSYKKSKDIRVRVEPDKREVIESKAKRYGLTVSAFMRLAALRYEIPGAPTLQIAAPRSPVRGNGSESDSE